jgi:HlyD family secretion protein
MNAPAPNRIFRQAALDKLASPEQLDELVTVADTRGWIGALGLGLVLAAFLAWGMFGTIRTEVQADGILVSEAGRVIGALAPAAGTVEALLVKPGDVVERGQVLARLNQDETRLRLRNAEAAAAELQQELDRRQASLDAQNAAMVGNIAERRSAYREVMQLTSERLVRLEEQLRGRETLRRQNLLTADQLEEVRVNIAQGRQEIGETRAKMAELGTTLLQFQSQAERDLADARRAAGDANRSVAELRLVLATAAAVVAPTSGRVTELAISDGEFVAANQLVLNVETQGRRLQAVVYVPTEHGKKVRPGMGGRLAPATVRKEEYGTMLGQVRDVSAFPATPQGMLAVLQNQNLVNSFAAAGAPYETRIDLPTAATPTGYQWTSGEGPPVDLTSGTTVRVWILVREEPPFNLILPFMQAGAGARQ